ncbi:MAG: DinB family protein [Spirochaetota bacterium]
MTFQEYVLHQLREMKRELLTAIEDLSAEDMFGFEPVGHWPIGWIAEHCTQVADAFLVAPVEGSQMLEYADQVQNWTTREPAPGDEYPVPAEIAERWSRVCDRIVSRVEEADETTLQESPGKEPYIQSILRVVNHTNSHLRSLWCILGERRVDEKWAVQQPFLA